MNNERMLDKVSLLTSDALERLVFIMGTSRGGTGMLRRAIDIHEEVLKMPYTHFMHQVWPYRHKVHDKLFKQVFLLPDFCDQNKIRQTLEEKEGEFLRWHIEKCLSSRNLRLMWQLYPLMYALSRENIPEVQNIKCWAEKEGDFADLETIRSNFPKAKFIFVVRDPRGAVGSLAKRVTIRSAAMDGLDPLAKVGLDRLALVNYCIHWRYAMQRMLKFSLSHPEISLMVRFEDFISAPEDHLNRIFEFISVTELGKEEITKRLGQLYYTTSNNPEEYEEKKGISKKSPERWKTFLTEFEINLIIRMTGRTARRLGYEIPKSRQGSGLVRILAGAKDFRQKVRTALKVLFVEVYELFV